MTHAHAAAGKSLNVVMGAANKIKCTIATIRRLFIRFVDVISTIAPPIIESPFNDHVRKIQNQSDAEALHSDWEAVCGDFRKAIDKIQAEMLSKNNKI